MAENQRKSSGNKNRPTSVSQNAQLAKNTVLQNLPTISKEKSDGCCRTKEIEETGREYCSQTSIHGLQYIGERERSLIEKIFWSLICIVSLGLCCQQIYDSYVKWQDSPVIVSFSEKSTPVWDLPFPAVTICPEAKSRKDIFNFTEVYHRITQYKSETEPSIPYNLSADEFKFLSAIGQVCDIHMTESLNLSSNIKFDILEKIQEISVDMDSSLLSCLWKPTPDISDCSNYFDTKITDDGVCFTFNGLDNKYLVRSQNSSMEDIDSEVPAWDLENGYDINANETTYPRRVLSSGIQSGMFILLSAFDYDTDYLCRGAAAGFKVLLHSPHETPRVTSQFIRVPFGKEILISVEPSLISTSENLRSYSPNRRQCFFSKERHLKYYNIYTQRNCELECLANFTLNKCGCVRFSMPDLNDPICGVTKRRCCEDAERELLQIEFIKSKNDKDHGCNCLPSCDSLSYKFEISQADLDVDNLLKAFGTDFEEPGIQLSRLSIFFKENQFLTSKRSELYGITDFLSSCGGLLGLFMGISALSIVEIFYFCTFRLFSKFKPKSSQPKANT